MENNMSEFLKMAYKRGRVKELQEAFEEYPVENEWHKGEEDFFLLAKIQKHIIVIQLVTLFL